MRLLLLPSALIPLAAAASYTCPPLGPVLPAARNPSAHPAVQRAVATFLASLEEEAAGFATSAVSIGIKSALEDEPLLDFHHTPPRRDARGAQAVGKDTVYRLASVSKVFTVLAALQRDDVVRWDDRVTKLEVEWDEVTVEAVAVHVSGIGADMMMDRGQYEGDWEALGLPPLEKKPACGGFLGQRPCTMEGDFLPNARLLQHRNSHRRARRGGGQVLQELILDPAGMSSTTYPHSPEDLSTLFIPENNTIWDWDLGVFAPAGGMYSTTRDMLRFGDAILRHRLLSPAKTRRWLKPSTFTSAPGEFVGKPWEGIFSANLTGGRPVEMYAKSGDIFNYHAGLALLPEYGLTVSVLAAGPEISAVVPAYYKWKLWALLPGLVRALDEASREEAASRVAGRFENAETGSAVTLRIDGGWGVRVEGWVVRGFEFVPNLGRYSHTGLNKTGMEPNPNVTARVYPTGLKSGDGKTEAWRAVFDYFTPEQREAIDREAFHANASCLSWGTVDRITYGYKALDHFEFVYGEDGRVEKVVPVAFGVELKRVEGEGEGGAQTN
ncbi:Beta-lactamase-like protein [Colletotrichum aenigma]|uniref:Beta-lactamase-like protein n=1 Tax=Colletotrichum aenigma TaxID=1215731 RepID=UPI0018733069|nr:Beta-lactamase-like protein [Colletotrichum aenigma]KAF5512936.1 Beta-lactamase-like protein [Colletotrichum aenigma]